jgi:uncharacterized phage protein (TIGR01671 family)
MKREIKFRAWDSKYNKMMSAEDTCLDISFNGYIVNNGLIHNRELDFTLMQFTGLLDKNGKEIYESDIIRFGYEDKVECVINWIQDICQFMMTATDKFPRYLKNGWNIDRPTIEVIGNIYENPELLNP